MIPLALIGILHAHSRDVLPRPDRSSPVRRAASQCEKVLRIVTVQRCTRIMVSSSRQTTRSHGGTQHTTPSRCTVDLPRCGDARPRGRGPVYELHVHTYTQLFLRPGALAEGRTYTRGADGYNFSSASCNGCAVTLYEPPFPSIHDGHPWAWRLGRRGGRCAMKPPCICTRSAPAARGQGALGFDLHSISDSITGSISDLQPDSITGPARERLTAQTT